MFAPPKLSSPTTIVVTAKKGHLKLDSSKDYIVKMPSSPVSIPGGLILAGGHNVVLIGGQVNTSGPAGKARGLYLKGQTGTVHVEGLRLSGAHPNEGIDLDERNGATVQLQNIKVDTVFGSYTTNHADVLQTWAGPTVLKVDRLDGSTGYQGFFLDPGKFGHVVPKSFEFHNTVLRDAGGTSKFLLWQSGQFKINTSGVTVVSHAKRAAAQTVRTVKSQSSWSAVTQGAASTPSPLIGTPGAGYRSPGYAGGAQPPAGTTDPAAGSAPTSGTDPADGADTSSDVASGAPVVQSGSDSSDGTSTDSTSTDGSTDGASSDSASSSSSSGGDDWSGTTSSTSSSTSSGSKHDHHEKD